MSVAPGALISPSDHHYGPRGSSPGPARSLTLWVPVWDTFGPLQSWFPAVTACSLRPSSAQGLPPFSGHRAPEPRAGLRGRSLRCKPHPLPGPLQGWEEHAPMDTPLRLLLAPPSPIRQCPGPEKPRPLAHTPASPLRAPTPASPTVPGAAWKDHAPPPCPSGSLKLPVYISDFGLPPDAPPLQAILSPPRRNEAEFRREPQGMPDGGAAWDGGKHSLY